MTTKLKTTGLYKRHKLKSLGGSGDMRVRLAPKLHAELTKRAGESRQSLNQYLNGVFEETLGVKAAVRRAAKRKNPIQISVRTSPTVHLAFNRRARDEGKTLTAFVTEIINRWLDDGV